MGRDGASPHTHTATNAMNRPRYLTKSRFKLAAECPTKLFYTGKEKLYRNTKQEDSFLAMLADGGYQVGELAKCCYPEGIEVGASEHEEALAMTAQLLQREKVTIFEAAIRHGDLFVRIDVLIKDGNHFQLIEVKAKSYNSEKPEILGARGDLLSGMRPYIEDVAFQAYVFRAEWSQAYLKTFLMMPDKAVAANIDGLNQLFKMERVGNRSKVVVSDQANTLPFDRHILALVCVDEYVAMVMDQGVAFLSFKEQLPVLASQWAQAYKDDLKIPPLPGKQCGSCEFRSTPGDGFKNGFEECWREKFEFTEQDFAKGTVLDLWKFRNKSELIGEGRVRLNSVRIDDLKLQDGGETLSATERQWMQANGIPPDEDRGGYWLSESLIRQEMAQWTYPYHFIDFETSAVALPFYAGMRPYEQIAFQFSHHVMHADGSIEHAGEFLMTDPGTFPNFAFARALKKELHRDKGTVFMWSPHENTILNRIIKQLTDTAVPPKDAQELVAFLQSLIKGGGRAMYDLCRLSREAYFHIGTKGSSSIKKVLPALLETSTWLKHRYSQPNYGGKGPIFSNNYADFIWWQPGSNGKAIDPYSLLSDYGSDLLGEPVLAGEDPDDLVIAEGGAAATAYSRLQFEDIKSDTRHKINQALLRYCELDTLAMVMIVQGWRDLLGSPPLSSNLNLTEKPSDEMTYFDYGSNLFDTANSRLEIDTAVMWITKAAELGYAPAQNKLGHLFSFSAKLGIDYERARFWMSASAGQGDAQGQTLLGIYYDNGFDDHADKARAIELYKAASAQGWAQAQYNLGWCYLNGNGVEVNIEKGRYFYQLAAEQNYRRAVVALAELDRANMKQVSL